MPESQEVRQLARRIYLENREVINLIHQQQPKWVAEAKQMLKEAVAGQSDWKLDLEDAYYVRFRSAQWDHFEMMRAGTGWLPESEALLLFQFGFDDGRSLAEPGPICRRRWTREGEAVRGRAATPGGVQTRRYVFERQLDDTA